MQFVQDQSPHYCNSFCRQKNLGHRIFKSIVIASNPLVTKVRDTRIQTKNTGIIHFNLHYCWDFIVRILEGTIPIFRKETSYAYIK